jgi:hypothetical protein
MTCPNPLTTTSRGAFCRIIVALARSFAVERADENRTRMASLEGRGHCASRAHFHRPRALVADAGLPEHAVRNGPLMAHALLPDEPNGRSSTL